MKIHELYSVRNKEFLEYMKNRELDIYKHWWEFSDWASKQPDVVAALEKVTGEDLDEEDYDDVRDNINDQDPEIFYQLPEHIQQEFDQEFRNSIAPGLAQHSPTDAPTWQHMDLNKNQLLKRDTWLIHFSDEAENIARYGFKYGIDDMDQLGLTKWFKDEAKKSGGYNFAFEADSRYVGWAESQKKYGRNAVMFQNSGVICQHFGDEEDQVVFHGEDVDPRSIIYLYCDYGTWCVCVHPGKRYNRDYVFKNDDIDVIVKWVKKNYRQYLKVITGW